MREELTITQCNRFLAEFLANPDATRAARLAGFEHPDEAGERMFTLPSVVKRITAGIDRRSEAFGIEVRRVFEGTDHAS